MKLTVLAVGTRMPGWVEAGIAEYSKRLPREWKFELRELAADRNRESAAKSMEREGARIREAIPSRDRRVMLDVEGRSFSTEQLARQLEQWQMTGDNFSLVIGGADGLEPTLLAEADLRWSLSPLTLPHPLVRVVLVEQLYRAWSINAGHPYHRS